MTNKKVREIKGKLVGWKPHGGRFKTGTVYVRMNGRQVIT